MAKSPAEPQPDTDSGGAAQAAAPAPVADGVQAPAPKPLEIPGALTVHDLASLMGRENIEVIKQLMRLGHMLTVNDVVEYETASLIANSFGFPVTPTAEEERGPGSLVISSDEEDPDRLQPRPPVVTLLGHVDHGKTTLLDAIRQTNTVSGEAGGITQHIGAYQVKVNDDLITFLDTPGHEAFTAMRARGAQVTDLAVLVVAADDGIMPQTVEAINHVKAAAVPLIATINKIDRPDADQERVKRQLAEHDLLIEEWGGDVVSVPVSALTGEGVPELLENILVVAEVGELKADPDRPAKGIVVEARIDRSKGPIATMLVQTGTLAIGDNVVVGEVRGRVKAMFNDNGERVKQAEPSVPVEVLGISGVPEAGDQFSVVSNEKTARRMVEERQRAREAEQGRGGATLEEVFSRIESGEIAALDLIVKTDVQGSIEAVRSALEHLNTETTRVNVIHAASGTITEPDVLLAAASKAIIIGFNSRPEPGAQTLSNQEGVDIRFYDIIYELIDEVGKAVQGLLAPVTRDVVEGYATVRAVFSIGRQGKAAGIYVNDGSISRAAQIHVMRNDRQLFAGPVASLKHFKDDVGEINSGLEGGIVVEGFQDYAEGDVLEAHITQQSE